MSSAGCVSWRRAAAAGETQPYLGVIQSRPLRTGRRFENTGKMIFVER